MPTPSWSSRKSLWALFPRARTAPEVSALLAGDLPIILNTGVPSRSGPTLDGRCQLPCLSSPRKFPARRAIPECSSDSALIFLALVGYGKGPPPGFAVLSGNSVQGFAG